MTPCVEGEVGARRGAGMQTRAVTTRIEGFL